MMKPCSVFGKPEHYLELLHAHGGGNMDGWPPTLGHV